MLQNSLNPALSELLNNVLTQKKKTYPEELKGFAASLMFYSSCAYNYVREVFMKALPHPRTVRSWFKNYDFHPGILTSVLESHQKEQQKNLKDGKF